ncbi:MAG: carboxylesterase family protein [Solobacterium sp.]|nr:carboxylesterase family protein [Solobacterium sp.]
MKTIDVRTECGVVRGCIENGMQVFRGIPYAEAPVGERRFLPPVRKEPWDGVREAMKDPAMCPQPDMTQGFYGKEFYTDPAFPLPEMSEDCLYLNIYAPKEIKEPLPAAVWIHGGGFDHGFNSEMEFGGEAYAAEDVILVTINYRVGVFGFLALEELRDADPHHSVGNAGMLDQVMALDWVYRNIAAFGGDPQRITVFGQSAGAISTETLLCSPLTEGIIHGAILQSAAGLDIGLKKYKTPEEAYAVGRCIMELTGTHSLAELRSVPAMKFVEILPELYKRMGGLTFVPVLDGWLLEEPQEEWIKGGKLRRIPYLIGSTAQDIMIPAGTDGRDSALYRGICAWAEANKDNTWQYYFDHALPSDDAGSFHSSELWYMFGTWQRCWREMTGKDAALSRQMVHAWTQFMKNGDPGWEKYPFCRTFGEKQ